VKTYNYSQYIEVVLKAHSTSSVKCIVFKDLQLAYGPLQKIILEFLLRISAGAI